MEISTQVNNQMITLDDNHLFNIQNNIDIWEKFQKDKNIIQKKLVQTTSILQTEGMQSFSLNITIPSTYFAGVEEIYSIGFTLNNHTNSVKREDNLMDNPEPIKLDLNFHRVTSIYTMNHVIQVIFNLLKEKFSHSDTESLEILTSLIVFEMEQLSKFRLSNTTISQEMFLINYPHVKWISNIHLKSQFNDYSTNNINRYYH